MAGTQSVGNSVVCRIAPATLLTRFVKYCTILTNNRWASFFTTVLCKRLLPLRGPASLEGCFQSAYSFRLGQVWWLGEGVVYQFVLPAMCWACLFLCSYVRILAFWLFAHGSHIRSVHFPVLFQMIDCHLVGETWKLEAVVPVSLQGKLVAPSGQNCLYMSCGKDDPTK